MTGPCHRNRQGGRKQILRLHEAYLEPKGFPPPPTMPEDFVTGSRRPGTPIPHRHGYDSGGAVRRGGGTKQKKTKSKGFPHPPTMPEDSRRSGTHHSTPHFWIRSRGAVRRGGGTNQNETQPEGLQHPPTMPKDSVSDSRRPCTPHSARHSWIRSRGALRRGGGQNKIKMARRKFC